MWHWEMKNWCPDESRWFFSVFRVSTADIFENHYFFAQNFFFWVRFHHNLILVFESKNILFYDNPLSVQGFYYYKFCICSSNLALVVFSCLLWPYCATANPVTGILGGVFLCYHPIYVTTNNKEKNNDLW